MIYATRRCLTLLRCPNNQYRIIFAIDHINITNNGDLVEWKISTSSVHWKLGEGEVSWNKAGVWEAGWATQSISNFQSDRRTKNKYRYYREGLSYPICDLITSEINSSACISGWHGLFLADVTILCSTWSDLSLELSLRILGPVISYFFASQW